MPNRGFDAVQTMRQIREELSRELDGRSFEQQKRYIRERVSVPHGPNAQEPSRPKTAEG